MSTEIEIRAVFENRARASDPLSANGYVLESTSRQVDVMHDKPDGELFVSGQKIRIRTEGDQAELTYKGAFAGDESASRRVELNISLTKSEAEKMSALLEGIGYPMLFRVAKSREVFRKDSIKATVDEWPIIGFMVELEGPEDAIKADAELLYPGVQFKNFRLRDLFAARELETGKSLSSLQNEYECSTGFSLGNIAFLLR